MSSCRNTIHFQEKLKGNAKEASFLIRCVCLRIYLRTDECFKKHSKARDIITVFGETSDLLLGAKVDCLQCVKNMMRCMTHS